MSDKNALIIGGGISGMALAIRLRGSGWAVDLVERDPQWRVYGAGISITAPTYRAFKRLGLLDPLISHGFASHAGVRICTAAGQIIVEQHIEPLESGLPTHGGILRPVLHAILSAQTRASGVRVRLGVTLASSQSLPDAVRVTATDGETGDYQLVVGADGIFSGTRDQLFPGAPQPKFTGQFCWRLTAERPPEIDRCHFYMGGAVTAGLTPISDTQMYLFLLHHQDEGLRTDEQTQWQILREKMRPFSGLLGKLRDELSGNSTIIGRPLEALLMPRPWSLGRVILIGDAAHATTPHLASGAGIAVEDAIVLCQELERQVDVPKALSSFEQRRWERCRLVVENSVRIGQMEQTHADPALLKALMAESEQALRQEV